ncbi:ribonuclease H-like protein [Dentipellis sp. KUC8613]|nr:ribonuclease H-like protein [Dentipellis sp. KUC8613]
MDPSISSEEPATRLERRRHGRTVDEEQLTAYTDGSCINNGKADAQCGSGVWIAEGHELNREIRVPGPRQSNQIGEIVAVIILLQIAANFAPILIRSDSRYVIDGLTEHLADWEDRGWIDVANAEYFEAAAYHLRKRSAPTDFEWVKGHNQNVGNDQADQSANRGARKQTPDEIDLSIPPAFKLQGAKLSTITQAIAYRGVRRKLRAKDVPRRATVRNIGLAQAALKDLYGNSETAATIWKQRSHKDIRKPIQQFLFRALHSTYRLGQDWKHIPNYEERAQCRACGSDNESLQHILVLCPAETKELIWKLARDLWPHGDDAWPDLSFGALLACGNLTVQPTATEGIGIRPRLCQAASTLLRILVSESLYLIWVLRCEREVGDREHSPQEIVARWTRTIEDRLLTDRIIATKLHHRHADMLYLKNTWHKVLLNPPDDWHTNIKVLVGIKPPSPLL